MRSRRTVFVDRTPEADVERHVIDGSVRGENDRAISKTCSLELHSVRLTDSSLLAFSKLSFLRSLSLIKADLSDDAVDGLSMFETLTQLNIQGNNISNDGIKRLQRSLGRCVIYGGDYDSMRNLVREIVQVNGTVTVSPEGEESRVIDQRTFNDLPSEFFIRKVDLSSVRPLPPHLLDVKDVTELDLSDSAVSIQSLRQLPSLAPAVTILNLQERLSQMQRSQSWLL